jgi:hypothetical protein
MTPFKFVQYMFVTAAFDAEVHVGRVLRVVAEKLRGRDVETRLQSWSPLLQAMWIIILLLTS